MHACDARTAGVLASECTRMCLLPVSVPQTDTRGQGPPWAHVSRRSRGLPAPQYLSFARHACAGCRRRPANCASGKQPAAAGRQRRCSARAIRRAPPTRATWFRPFCPAAPAACMPAPAASRSTAARRRSWRMRRLLRLAAGRGAGGLRARRHAAALTTTPGMRTCLHGSVAPWTA